MVGGSPGFRAFTGLKLAPKTRNQRLPTECRQLITFANRLDPDQARQNVSGLIWIQSV